MIINRKIVIMITKSDALDIAGMNRDYNAGKC